MGDKTESHRSVAGDLRHPWPRMIQGLCGVLQRDLLVLDPQRRIVFASEGLERLLHYSAGQLLGVPLDGIVMEPSAPPQLIRRFDGGHVPGKAETMPNRSVRIRAQDGRELEVQASITDYELDSVCYQFWVLEPTGGPVANPTVAGVAHDIKGVMAAIRNFTSVALYHSQDQATVEPLRHVLSAADRVAEMVQQLMPGTQRKEAAVATAIANSVTLLEMARPAHLQLHSKVDLRPNTTTACLDAQWHRLVLNLGWNAFAASTTPSDVYLTVAQIDAAEPLTCVHSLLPVGTYVLLEVADEGSGVDHENVWQLFEPYVSSRSTINERRGLGLYVVRSIVEQLAGGIQVHPNVPRGTRFRVFVPCIPNTRHIADTKRPACNEERR